MITQSYTENDLLVRTSVAADAISKVGASLATRLRRGSVEYCEQKCLELVTQQLNAIRRGFVVDGDNVLTETEVDDMFNNISKFTGCKYAPLGTTYI